MMQVDLDEIKKRMLDHIELEEESVKSIEFDYSKEGFKKEYLDDLEILVAVARNRQLFNGKTDDEKRELDRAFMLGMKEGRLMGLGSAELIVRGEDGGENWNDRFFSMEDE